MVDIQQHRLNLLSELLENMDIPEVRRKELNLANLQWLSHNFMIRNTGKRGSTEAHVLIAALLRDWES